MELKRDKHKIIQLAEEVDAWANLFFDKRNYSKSLRSSVLKPPEEISTFVKPLKRQRIVSDVSSRRSKFLKEKSVVLSGLSKGRLLGFYPDQSHQDGIVSMFCNDFISQEDCPPWDIWLFCSTNSIEDGYEGESCLFSWVPEQLVSLVDKAIGQDAFESLIWCKKFERELGIR